MKKFIQISLLGIFTACLAVTGYFLLNNPHFKSFEQNSYFETKNNHGTYKEHYSNGKLKSVDRYSEGKRNGTSLTFSSSGDTISSTNYKNGYKDGTSKTFDSKGELVKTKSYSLGFLTSENILNDSIYKYDILSYETGSELYYSECKSCHTTASLNNKNITHASLDTIHFALDDSIKMDSTTFKQLSTSDLSSLSSFISELNEEAKSKSIPFLVFRKKHFKNI